MISHTENIDCIEGMKKYADKYFDLAIVAPPSGKDTPAPGSEYFTELLRVSKNQIIWGASHYTDRLPYNSKCWLVWNKLSNNKEFSDCVLAWTSFDSPVRMFTHTFEIENRIHPYQEPIQLHEWTLDFYAKEGDKIIDTHMGSGSTRLACFRKKFDFVGFEIDKNYFDAEEERFKKFLSNEYIGMGITEKA